jgi:uncharacterized cupredoxin-like copper-binding protein
VRRAFPLPVVAALATASILVVSGCGESPGTHRGARLVRVTERDFRISAPKRIPAGDVVFRVRNNGPDDHELLVVRHEGEEEEGEEELPLRADGLTVDEDGLGSRLVEGLEAGEPGARELRVNLKPGHYELFCNMKGHYLAGMEAEIEAQ